MSLSLVRNLCDSIDQSYSYREYIKQSVARDLKVKYKRSFLGYIWTMLHPLMMMAILSIVFSHVVRMPMADYSVFLFCGLLPWGYFHSTSMMSIGNVRANARLISHLPVPPYVFIVSLSLSNLVNLLLSIFPLLLLMLVLGHPLGSSILALPLVLFPLYFTTLAVGLFLSALNVFFDDTLHLAEVGLQALYFLSPVLYARTALPPWLGEFLVFNPLCYQIELFRQIFYDGRWPDPVNYSISLATSIILLSLSFALFNKLKDRFLYFI